MLKTQLKYFLNQRRPVIFFLLDRRNDTIKIGCTRNLISRIKSIKSNNPYMNLIGIIPCSDGTLYYAKSRAVRWNSSSKLSGDIFMADDSLIEYINKWGYYFG